MGFKWATTNWPVSGGGPRFGCRGLGVSGESTTFFISGAVKPAAGVWKDKPTAE